MYQGLYTQLTDDCVACDLCKEMVYVTRWSVRGGH